MMNKKKKKLIFYCLMSAFPVAQFLIFYVAVNANSVIYAFQKYDYTAQKYVWGGFANFKSVCSDIVNAGYFKYAFVNSLLLYAVSLIVGTTLALLFSYYIYKKARFSGFYKILLFMPSILSNIALVLVFKYFAELFVPEIWSKIFGYKPEGLIYNMKTVLPTLIFFNVWSSFGVPVLLYASAMSAVSPSVSESAKIDGAGVWREFWHITLPLIYPTLVTFMIAGLTGMFLHQMSAFSFFSFEAEYNVYTVGYFLYTKALSSKTTLADYPYLAAFGVLLTAVMIPFTLLVKKGLEKLGPKTV